MYFFGIYCIFSNSHILGINPNLMCIRASDVSTCKEMPQLVKPHQSHHLTKQVLSS